jgi:hypothetical protein
MADEIMSQSDIDTLIAKMSDGGDAAPPADAAPCDPDDAAPALEGD